MIGKLFGTVGIEIQPQVPRNLAQRGGLTKPQMLERYGRFPKKGEWWGEDGSYEAWKARWVAAHPQ